MIELLALLMILVVLILFMSKHANEPFNLKIDIERLNRYKSKTPDELKKLEVSFAGRNYSRFSSDD